MPLDPHQLESFALAPDRAKALEQLIPGTEDWYFHSCLVHEQAGRYGEIDALLRSWVQRYGETALCREIRHRLALLRHPAEPAKTLEYLRTHLGLRLDHQREVEGRALGYPTRLDPQLVSRAAVKRMGFAHSHPGDLAGFTEAALDWLVDEAMDVARLRQFLSRLTRPDHAKLPQLILAELQDKHSSGFGSLPIHALLLQDQLDALAKSRPALRNEANWVFAYLARLQPGPDADWRNRAPDREAFLDRLWAFVRPLAPSFNGLKAHVLWHRLDHDRRLGVYDRARFLEYVKLPRQGRYAEPKYLETFRDEARPFALGEDHSAATLHPPVRDDEELVRDYLDRFFRDAKDSQEYEKYMQVAFLRELFATTKILHGIGDPQQWFALLDDPGAFQALKDRVELGFARTNPAWFAAADPVALEIDVKNVTTLVVKVFEINALNYFLAHGREVDTSVDLDGLVASEEKTCTYDEPPVRRVRRKFEFPGLARSGVWVVEFLGGGISSRALLRKGRLRFLERVGAAGHVFTVLDEDRKPVPDAAVWLGGREFRARDGEIRVPFSTRPGRQSILLRAPDALTTVDAFEHRAEEYRFAAGFHVDRESLLRKREAQLLVRATLDLHGAPAGLSLIEDPTLTIRSTDRDGVDATLEVPNFALYEDRESVHTFQVPENLAAISFTLRGKVQNVSQSRKEDVAATHGLALNGIDATGHIACLHLARSAAGWVLHLLGKTGEPRAGAAVNLSLRHRDLVPELAFTLQTDARGRVELGHLRDVLEVAATAPAGVTDRWTLARDRCRRPGSIHAREGERIRIPVMDVEPLGGTGVLDEHGKPARPAAAADRRDFSLLERLGAGYVRDRFGALSRKDGFLEVAGLPAGDYDLALKREGVSVAIRVVPGEDRHGWVAGVRRQLERQDGAPLQVAAVVVGQDEVEVRLSGAGGATRVHVFGTRMLPAHSAFDDLGGAGGAEPRWMEVFRGLSHYVSGRDIGDEYRYILERKYARKYPGNLLARPGLLLNPWAVRSTMTTTQEAAVGGAYAASPAPMASMAADCEAEADSGAGAAGAFATLDFLAQPAAVLANLRPDAQGIVRFPRAALAHANQVRVLAVSPGDAVCRDLLLPEVDPAPQDLRLRLALDADSHFTERKQVSRLAPGQPLELADITTSRVEVYDTLARVYRLLGTLSNDATLATFGFLLRWPQMTEEEKRGKYSEFASHELGFFVSCKDEEFFARVIRPYLRNKKDKTFLDRWLLGDDLAGYRTPWAYGRLNVVERILLARRFDDEGDPCARHVGDWNDLTPRDLEYAERLFQSAIRGSALEAGDKLGIGRAKDAAESVMLLKSATAGPPGAKGMAMPARMAGKMRSARGAMEKQKKAKAEAESCEELPDAEFADLDDCLSEAAGGEGGRARRDQAARGEMRQFYQKLDRTQEWAENNYYKRTIDAQGPDLVTANPFWRDYAAHRFPGPFLSSNVAYASRNFTEMMFALSVLDLPFAADAPAVEFSGARMKLTGKGRALAFHKEIMPAERAPERVPVLVSQNYFRDDDRMRYEDGERVDKYVTGEFLVDVVYACQAVLTNPTSSSQKLDLLVQIPLGAIPVKSGFVTKGMPVELAAYATQSIEYAFYFPAPGAFAHFPVHVARNERLIACAEPARLAVVRELSTVDKTSWAWVSQNGEVRDVLKWMDENNLDRLSQPDGSGRVPLERIAWRMRERDFYEPCLALLRRRHVYQNTLWSYSLKHGDVPNIREYLLHQDGFLGQCGAWLESALVKIDPVARGCYQHLEYAPLVNARVQKLGARRKILNDRLAAQYVALMNVLRYKATAAVSDDDRLATAYYLLLQDRFEEGLGWLDRVDWGRVETGLQHDYLMVWADLLRERPGAAREIAERHRDHPVDRWRDLFRNALGQIAEIEGAPAKVVDEEDREQRQAALAATEPDFEFTVEKKTVTVNWQNLSAVRVNYYRMDIELLFSRQPFVQRQSGQFGFIRPNRTEEVSLPEGRKTLAFELPAEFHGANVIVELVAEGKGKSQAYYAHELSVQVLENWGRLQVTRQGTGRPLAKTYVKVYARMQGGEVKFTKDGYTDLRGAFDYTSLNTNELDFVERFAILVLSDEHGAVIREAAPPKR